MWIIPYPEGGYIYAAQGFLPFLTPFRASFLRPEDWTLEGRRIFNFDFSLRLLLRIYRFVTVLLMIAKNAGLNSNMAIIDGSGTGTLC